MIEQEDFKRFWFATFEVAADLHNTPVVDSRIDPESLGPFAWELSRPESYVEKIELMPHLRDEFEERGLLRTVSTITFRKAFVPDNDTGEMKLLMALVDMTNTEGELLYPHMLEDDIDFVNEAVVRTLHEVSPGFQDGMVHISNQGDGENVIRNLDEVMKMKAEAEIDREVESFRQSLDNIFGGGET